MTDIENLPNLNRKLTALLDDPHPELFTWHRAVYDIVLDMALFVGLDGYLLPGVKDPLTTRK